jgi:hypothetical protein
MMACGGEQFAIGAADGSVEVTDAPVHDGSEASRDLGDVTSDRGVAKRDAGGVTDGGAGESHDECVDEGVPPSTLRCTGLYADIAKKTLASRVHFYQPAVPLWSDNAEKMRWIELPPGTQIDTSDPNEWTFPVGTKVWKEFRIFQKIESGPPPYWVHATYAWNADESAAVATGGGDISLDSNRGPYHIPTFAECEKCHNGRTDHILGFEQVSLGQQGAQGLTLSELASQGLVAPVPTRTQLSIGDDGTGAAAPALAWLHVNCGVTCHNANSNAAAYGLGMRLRLDPALLDGRPPTVSDFDSMRTTIGVVAHSPGWVQPVHWTRIVPGDASHSLLAQLISNRGTDNPVRGQMPPIASSIVDTVDVANVVNWIERLPSAPAIDAGSDADAGIADSSDEARVEDGAADAE